MLLLKMDQIVSRLFKNSPDYKATTLIWK